MFRTTNQKVSNQGWSRGLPLNLRWIGIYTVLNNQHTYHTIATWWSFMAKCESVLGRFIGFLMMGHHNPKTVASPSNYLHYNHYIYEYTNIYIYTYTPVPWKIGIIQYLSNYCQMLQDTTIHSSANHQLTISHSGFPKFCRRWTHRYSHPGQS